MTLRLARLFTCLALVAAGSGSLFAAVDCDRACLRTTLDQYLTAVTKHDPSSAPLFIGFRQTENATVVKLGSGVWKTVTALGKVQRRYLDPVTGHAGYFGLIEENGAPAIATVRLKVENKKISEAEWVISRKGDPGLNGPAGGNVFDADNLIANPPSDKPVAKEARISREAMIAIANSYFDGITTHDGSLSLGYPGCVRLENGVTMAGRGAAPAGAVRIQSGIARQVWKRSTYKMSLLVDIPSWMKRRVSCWRWPFSFENLERQHGGICSANGFFWTTTK